MRKKVKSVFEKILYAILIAFAVVSFWRGVWGLMDIYLFPSNPTLSLFSSLFIGLVILAFTHHLIKELT